MSHLTAARQALASTCIPMAYQLAGRSLRRMRGRAELEEIQGEALLALTYQANRGTAFPSWAFRIINQELSGVFRKRWS